MSRQRAMLAVAAVCAAIALYLHQRHQPAATPSAVEVPVAVSAPQALEAPGLAAVPPLASPGTPGVQAHPAASASPTPAPLLESPQSPAASPARDPAVRQALDRFARDVSIDLDRCSASAGGMKASIPVQLALRPVRRTAGGRQPFLVVRATPLSRGGPIRPSAAAEDCLRTAAVGRTVFTASTQPATEFQQVLMVQMSAVQAKRL